MITFGKGNTTLRKCQNNSLRIPIQYSANHHNQTHMSGNFQLYVPCHAYKSETGLRTKSHLGLGRNPIWFLDCITFRVRDQIAFGSGSKNRILDSGPIQVWVQDRFSFRSRNLGQGRNHIWVRDQFAFDGIAFGSETQVCKKLTNNFH